MGKGLSVVRCEMRIGEFLAGKHSGLKNRLFVFRLALCIHILSSYLKGSDLLLHSSNLLICTVAFIESRKVSGLQPGVV